MALVKMKELLTRAEQQGNGCGAFNVGNMEMVKGVIEAAEDMQTSVIMQIAEGRLEYSPLELMGPMMVEAARNASVDIAVHLDHGKNIRTIKKALEFGFTSVMFDGSTLPFKTNVSMMKEVVELASEYGASTEGELGIVGGSEDGGEGLRIKCTDPIDAMQFCRKTGVDALAVAIGNAHGNYPVAPTLQFHVLKQIKEKAELPLVLHGGSGIEDKDFQKSIQFGIRKINIATASFDALTKSAEEYMKYTDTPNFFDLNEAMVDGVYKNVKKHISVFNEKTSF